jgi:eukaryotic-like serine/threonine-protein kinase
VRGFAATAHEPRANGPGVREYPIARNSAPHDIITLPDTSYATDWSRDGRFVLITRKMNTDADLAYYDFSDQRLKPFLSTAAHEDFGVLSPDGRWIAYASNRTGKFEVYVRRFPEGGEEQRVSMSGGLHPRWRGTDGKELFFLLGDGTMMAADLKYEPSLQVVARKALFRVAMVDIIHGLVAPYDVAPDGQKFLVIVPVQSIPVPLTLVQNWKVLIER